jgi:hypothetical protein
MEINNVKNKKQLTQEHCVLIFIITNFSRYCNNINHVNKYNNFYNYFINKNNGGIMKVMTQKILETVSPMELNYYISENIDVEYI